MDRQIVYPGQILPETGLLQMTKDAMIGTAKLASALLGTSTYASGFAVTPTGPASLQVVYAPGEIYSLSSIDALAFSTLPADTTHSILKQGILLDGGNLSCPAPGTSGQSINYLVQATYQDSDANPVLLPYYNSSNPAMPYSGAGNNGLTQNTVRKGIAVVTVKAGASAITGSQVTPAPDAGYVGLYVVTVAFGQTTITSGNITQAANAPLINSTLHGVLPTFTVSPVIPAATMANQAMQLGQASGVVGQARNVRMYVQAASATGTLTADEVIVESVLGGLRYCVASVNKTINMATTGAGGMDIGSAPINGFVALYLIYNPTAQVSALLATNANALVGQVYGGANMPSGYTASALVAVLPTNASSVFKPFFLRERKVSIASVPAISTSTAAATPTALAIANLVPANAISIIGGIGLNSNASSQLTGSVLADAVNSLGFQGLSGIGTAVSGSYEVDMTVAQNLYYMFSSTSGTPIFVISISSYRF